MKDSIIEDLAYRIKLAKQAREAKQDIDQNENLPIVFLGAGASKTGDIPLAGKIVDDILDNYKDNPGVKRIKDTGDKTYAKMMECLMPSERNKLLKAYIDRAKINVTHIYLAQLLSLGYVDYVLTVNFDNLMLRALALFNEFPPVYDMAILKDLTTTNFKEKSVLYLHGQHHGLWLLNTQEEMDKVKEFIPPILNKIANRRPWIFIGYSGEDAIFNHVVNLGRFDDGLYWVCYKDTKPSERVCTNLLDKPNTNTFIIKGYDSDSFMIKLNQELGLPQPQIIDKPFTSLKKSLENIVDIDNDAHFKGVKERLEIVKAQVDTAISQFEMGVIPTEGNLKDATEIDRLKKEIIDKIIKEYYDKAEIELIAARAAELNDTDLNKQLADLYIYWGVAIYDSAKLENDKELYRQSMEKYERAAVLNPKDAWVFYNWGVAIFDLAKLDSDADLYRESINKYKTAAELDPNNDLAFTNWGNALDELARLKNDEELFKESIEKSKIAADLNPANDLAFTNWGAAVFGLAKMNNNEALFKECIEISEKAADLNPANDLAFTNWGAALLNLAKITKDDSLYRQSFEKLNKAFDLSGESYNLACAYAVTKDKINALKYLENSLENNQITVGFVEKDYDWKEFADDDDFKDLLNRFR